LARRSGRFSTLVYPGGGVLLQTPLGARVEARLFRDGEEFHAPHLMDVEVTQGLRRLVRSGEVSATRAAEAIEDLGDLDLHRHAQ
jgi:predicted nucleic acid-binding protein